MDETEKPETIYILKWWHIFVYVVGVVFLTGGAYYRISEDADTISEHEKRIRTIEVSYIETKTYLMGFDKDLQEIKLLLRRSTPAERRRWNGNSDD